MLYDERHLPEILYMKHRHDDDADWTDYENAMLDKMLSPYIYENDMMNSYLKKLQPLAAKLFDQMNIIKNWRNYMVDKYHYKHNR